MNCLSGWRRLAMNCFSSWRRLAMISAHLVLTVTRKITTLDQILLKFFIALETTEISKDSCGLDLCAYRKELWLWESIREKEVDTLLPFFSSKVEKGKVLCIQRPELKKTWLSVIFFRLVHNLWSQDYYRFSYVWMNLKYPEGEKTHTILTNKRKKKPKKTKKLFPICFFFHGKRKTRI